MPSASGRCFDQSAKLWRRARRYLQALCGPARRRPHRRNQPRVLSFDDLEERSVLSTFPVVNTLDAGAGSLRQAILDANASFGLSTIRFQIGSGLQTIQPTSPLPTLIYPVVIDGTTQPGYANKPLIQLDGTLAGPSVNGLTHRRGAEHGPRPRDQSLRRQRHRNRLGRQRCHSGQLSRHRSHRHARPGQRRLRHRP